MILVCAALGAGCSQPQAETRAARAPAPLADSSRDPAPPRPPVEAPPEVAAAASTVVEPELDCVDEDLASQLGAVLEVWPPHVGDDYALPCSPARAVGEDYVIRWTAPEAGLYEFQITGDVNGAAALVEPACDGGAVLDCVDDYDYRQPVLHRQFEANEVVHLVVEGYDEDFGFGLIIERGRTVEPKKAEPWHE